MNNVLQWAWGNYNKQFQEAQKHNRNEEPTMEKTTHKISLSCWEGETVFDMELTTEELILLKKISDRSHELGGNGDPVLTIDNED